MRHLTFLIVLCGFLGRSYAGCDNLIAPAKVRGKTYVMTSTNSPYPKKLHFNLDSSVTYGSAVDGHPGGTFWIQGLCNELFAVNFVPSLGPDTQEKTALLLKATDKSYRTLVEINQGQTFTLKSEVSKQCKVQPQNDCSTSPKRLCCDCVDGILLCN
jgi:hypothetical protein